MLGKGLESLIPPQGNGDNHPAEPIRRVQGEPPRPPQNLSGRHGIPEDSLGEDSGPQILHFEFGEEVATPAVAETVTAKSATVKRGSVDEVFIPAKENRPNEHPQDYIFHIEVGKIRPNPNQPRRHFDEEALDDLAKSIREFGFLQPLVVTRLHKTTEGGVGVEYELISGERRLLAAKRLGLEYVPAIIREIDLEREKLELAVIENIQREDLNPIERARAFQRLQEEFRLTQREIASKLGKSRESVANNVRLLDLPLYVQEALEKGKLTESHGRFLLAIEDTSAQKKLFDDILAHGLTTRDVKNRVQASTAKKSKSATNLTPELKMFEERLMAELGTPVKIERNANTGKIVIIFYSEEELKNIMQRFGGSER